MKRNYGRVVAYEPLIWEPAEPTEPSNEMTPSQRYELRISRALATPGFDPHWDVRKCDHCGRVFKLKYGRGNWRARRFCCRQCADAHRQAMHRRK